MADNKTLTWAATDSTTDNDLGTSASDDTHYHWSKYMFSTIASYTYNNIPPYSEIKSAVLNIDAWRSASSMNLASTSKGDCEFSFADSTSVKKSLLSGTYKWRNEHATLTNYDISSYVRSKDSASGTLEYSGASNILCRMVYGYNFSITFDSKVSITWTYNEPRAIVSVSKTGEGTVTGAGTYHYGNNYTITATPATGYKFVKWSDGDTNASRTFTVNSSLIRAYETSKSYQAVFEKQSYTLTVTAGTGGTVTGGGSYAYGDTATLTATPSTGYKFVKWNDGNTSASRTVTVTSAATYTATFERLSYSVSTSVSPTGSGTVTGGGTYEHGKTVTLKATANSGYKFVKWNDNVTTASRTITVTDAVTYTAYFELDKINKIYVDTSQPTGIYVDETTKKIVFVINGTVSTTNSSVFDTIDGYHIVVQNTIPSGMEEIKEVYVDTTKVYG